MHFTQCCHSSVHSFLTSFRLGTGLAKITGTCIFTCNTPKTHPFQACFKVHGHSLFLLRTRGLARSTSSSSSRNALHLPPPIHNTTMVANSTQEDLPLPQPANTHVCACRPKHVTTLGGMTHGVLIPHVHIPNHTTRLCMSNPHASTTWCESGMLHK